MKRIGLFEARTKFSEICERVSAKSEAVLVTRRGKPLVKITPVATEELKVAAVWDRRAQYERKARPPGRGFHATTA